MGKNQNDMIFSIVAVVLALIIAGVLYATQPEVTPQVAVAPINIAEAQLPGADAVMADGLPNAGSAPAAGGSVGMPMAGGPTAGPSRGGQGATKNFALPGAAGM